MPGLGLDDLAAGAAKAREVATQIGAAAAGAGPTAGAQGGCEGGSEGGSEAAPGRGEQLQALVAAGVERLGGRDGAVAGALAPIAEKVVGMCTLRGSTKIHEWKTYE